MSKLQTKIHGITDKCEYIFQDGIQYKRVLTYEAKISIKLLRSAERAKNIHDAIEGLWRDKLEKARRKMDV